MHVSTTLALQVRFPLLHRKEIIFFDGRPRRTSLQHGMVFHEDADPKMIGHQRSSTLGPALSLCRRKFSTSKKV